MASTSTPLSTFARTPFAALPLSRFYAVPECLSSSAKKPSFTPGSATLKRRFSPGTIASPCKKRATKPSTPGEFAIPRAPRAVSKCLFEDTEMDADESGFGASPAMKLNYDPVASSSPPSTSYLAPPLLMDTFPTQPSTSASPKMPRKPDALVLAPSPEIVSNPSRSSLAPTSRWANGKSRDPDSHHPGFDVYCDPIGYDTDSMASPLAWDEEPSLPELVFDSPKENDAPPRKAKRMPPPMPLIKDGPGSSPLGSTPKRPSRLATSTSIESPWARMQLGESSNSVNPSEFPAA